MIGKVRKGKNMTIVLNPQKKSEHKEENSEFHSNCVKLCKKDKVLYGLCPAQDDFVLVVCQFCNSLVQQQELLRHAERFHSDAISKRILNQVADTVISETSASVPSASNNSSSSQSAKKKQSSSTSSSTSSSRRKKNDVARSYEHATNFIHTPQQPHPGRTVIDLRSVQDSETVQNTKDLPPVRPAAPESQNSGKSRKSSKRKSTARDKKSRPTISQEIHLNATHLTHQNSDPFGYHSDKLCNVPDQKILYMSSLNSLKIEDKSRETVNGRSDRISSSTSASKRKKLFDGSKPSNVLDHITVTSDNSNTTSSLQLRIPSSSPECGTPRLCPVISLETGRPCMNPWPCRLHDGVFQSDVSGHLDDLSRNSRIKSNVDHLLAQTSTIWPTNGGREQEAVTPHCRFYGHLSNYQSSSQSDTSSFHIDSPYVALTAANTQGLSDAVDCLSHPSINMSPHKSTKQSISLPPNDLLNRRLQGPQRQATSHTYPHEDDSEEDEDIPPDFSTDPPYIKRYPRPSAICDFGLWQIDNRVYSRNRKYEQLRSAVKLLAARLEAAKSNQDYSSVCGRDTLSIPSDSIIPPSGRSSNSSIMVQPVSPCSNRLEALSCWPNLSETTSSQKPIPHLVKERSSKRKHSIPNGTHKDLKTPPNMPTQEFSIMDMNGLEEDMNIAVPNLTIEDSMLNREVILLDADRVSIASNGFPVCLPGSSSSDGQNSIITVAYTDGSVGYFKKGQLFSYVPSQMDSPNIPLTLFNGTQQSFCIPDSHVPTSGPQSYVDMDRNVWYGKSHQQSGTATCTQRSNGQKR